MGEPLIIGIIGIGIIAGIAIGFISYSLFRYLLDTNVSTDGELISKVAKSCLEVW